MSYKRKHDDAPGEASAAPKPFKKHRPFKPGQNNQQTKNHKRPNLSHDDENGRSTNALKSRIRDLKRFLTHMDSVEKHKMSAGARQERERELEACEHELAEKVKAGREAAYSQKMIGKYHQVRFFDRKRGERILKRLKKEHAAAENNEQKGELRQKIHNAEVDVNYAIYYPLMKPYSSLYPKSRKQKASDSEEAEDTGEDNKDSAEVDGPKGDVEMWKKVEQAMEDNTLKELRYSKDALPAEPPKKKPKVKESKKSKSEGKANKSQEQASGSKNCTAQEEDEESDGGFFE